MATERPVLLAGAPGAERKAPGGVDRTPGWHQPAHVRQPAVARRLLAEQVRAGADAIVAPSYRTSRAVLAAYGEARRAGEWTQAAVRLAREATVEADRQVLICGSLPAGTGDFEAHAGTLAEAGVDVLLVELMASVAEARVASLAAAATGLPVWSGARLDSGEWLGEWAEAVEPATPERLLLYGSAVDVAGGMAELGRLTDRPMGACLTEPAGKEAAARLLEQGASLLGLAWDATPQALKPLREAIDELTQATLQAQAEATQAWLAWLERAARWAPGGPALWLGDEPQLGLPAGFAWSVASLAELGRLPHGRYRLLIVAPEAELDRTPPADISGLLDEGGVLFGPSQLASGAGATTRVMDLADEPPLVILQRN